VIADARGVMLAGLSGATRAVHVSDHQELCRAVIHLLNCHNHHFAVIQDQRAIICSEMATRCLAGTRERQ
jgi:hypothetical protein